MWRAAAMVLPALLVACSAFAPEPEPALTDAGVPIESLDLDAEVVAPPPFENIPTGPVVRVMAGRIAGTGVSVMARDDPAGMCIEIRYEGAGASGMNCGGTMPGEGRHAEVFGWLGSGASGVVPGVIEMSGVVPVETGAVVIETRSGAAARATLVPLRPARIDAVLFLAYLPEGDEARAAVAVDGDGSVLERFEFAPLAPPLERGVPTPAP